MVRTCMFEFVCNKTESDLFIVPFHAPRCVNAILVVNLRAVNYSSGRLLPTILCISRGLILALFGISFSVHSF